MSGEKHGGVELHLARQRAELAAELARAMGEGRAHDDDLKELLSALYEALTHPDLEHVLDAYARAQYYYYDKIYTGVEDVVDRALVAARQRLVAALRGQS